MNGTNRIQAAMANFPATFGLRAFPGETFRISERSSYTTDTAVYLYTQRKVGDQWLDFAKGTPAELQAEVVKL